MAAAPRTPQEPQAHEPPSPTISTHVLDTERGRPAAGIHVTLSRLADDGKPVRMTQALTDQDGRVRDLLERPLIEGDYRLEFRLGDKGLDGPDDAFFRRLSVDLRVIDVSRSYHVPLLLSSFGMTTYRGS